MLHATYRRRQAAFRPLLLLMASVLLALPTEQAAASRRDDIAQAKALSQAGLHQQAARLYEKATFRRFLGPDEKTALRAAREYVAAGQFDAAKRMADVAGDGRLKGKDATRYAMVRAEIALAGNEPQAALAALSTIPDPPPASEAAAVAELRRRTNAMIKPPPPPGSLPAPVVEAPPASGPPGLSMLPSERPAQIALLLPLSGRLRNAGAAVRDGFLAAWLARPAEYRPRVDIYDTASSGAEAAFRRALSEGAQFAVGPLTKSNVQSLANGQQIPVPVLALNSLESGLPPAFMFRYSLDPEEEARAVARRIAADGLTQGVALFPDNSWGERLRNAFTDEALLSGLTLNAVQFYDPASKDYSGPLRAVLGQYGGAAERTEGKGSAAVRDGTTQALAGPQFMFMAATARAARAMIPQLRFQMTYRLPVYSTSDAWVAGSHGGSDFEGMVFPEIPWVLYKGQGAPQLWDTVNQGPWSGNARGRLRLYAFGYDAYLHMNELRGNVRHIGLSGLTGGLEMTESGTVRRRLDFARIEGGQPQPAGSPVPILLPSAP